MNGSSPTYNGDTLDVNGCNTAINCLHLANYSASSLIGGCLDLVTPPVATSEHTGPGPLSDEVAV